MADEAVTPTAAAPPATNGVDSDEEDPSKLRPVNIEQVNLNFCS